jgi:hypothetical protein
MKKGSVNPRSIVREKNPLVKAVKLTHPEERSTLLPASGAA